MIIKLIDLFLAFLKVGLLSFGGGYTFIPLIEHESVEVYKWVTHDEFMKIIGASELIPGAISIKYATYIGYKVAGLLGIAATVAGSILVPVTGIIILFNVIKAFKNSFALNSMFTGLRSATWGLIIGLGVKSFAKTSMSYGSIIIGVGALIAIAKFNISPALIMISAALLGLVFYS